MNKKNPTPVPSQEPLVTANAKLMAAIAKDLESQNEKSIGELLEENDKEADDTKKN
jgi:hypothetical protein